MLRATPMMKSNKKWFEKVNKTYNLDLSVIATAKDGKKL